ncbi:uncharacterized protein ACNLHF_021840 isoform 1-T2 [Anomaloglossus baeobatrachus]
MNNGEEILKKVLGYAPKDHGLPVIQSPNKTEGSMIKPLPIRKYGKHKVPGANRFGQKAEAQKSDIDILNNSATSDQKFVDKEEAVSQSREWILVFGIKLSHQDRQEVCDGNWLNDNVINVCQYLISKQHPTIGFFFDTVIVTHSSLDVRVVEHTLQSHHLGAHWLVSEARGTKVTIYDSLPFSGISEILRKQIVKIYAPLFTGLNKGLTVNYVCPQKQEGGNDCGVFAIANCLALANKMDLSKILFIPGGDQQNLQPFPCSTFENKPKVKKMTLTIYCICHMFTSEAMIECDHCKMWLHFSCAGISAKRDELLLKIHFYVKHANINVFLYFHFFAAQGIFFFSSHGQLSKEPVNMTLD